ncbi:MAG: M48 family metallopeptidase [Actinobacteria bacterium]|nr:M48 family metallopeptidase [Actinomycetota bacterium]
MAAGAATLALKPRGGLIQAAPAKPQAYFSTRELDRIHDYVGTQRLLGLGGLALTGAVLVVFAVRPPAVVRRTVDRMGDRPLSGAAVTGGGIFLAIALVTLPLSAAAQNRAKSFGLSTQSWPSWAGDVVKSDAINLVFAAAGGALLVLLIRRFPRHWWLPGAVAIVAVAALFEFLGPVVLDPLFNRFTPLPRGPLRSEVLDLARRAGVRVGQVYRVDASRRTTGANAYVNGLGATKRVVLYDTLIRDYRPAELRSVVAHELGHVKHRDVPRGLLWLAIVAPAATLLIQRLVELRRAEPAADGLAGPAVVPVATLAIAVVAFAAGIGGNVLSRRVEASADAFALRLTHDPRAFIDVERRLTTGNLIDPDPPGWLVDLFGTHPPAIERIGYALEFERGG